MSKWAASTAIAVLGLHLTIASAGRARADAPATDRAAQAGEVDRDSPLTAMRGLWEAVAAADEAAISALLHAETPAEREMVVGIAELLVAGERLRREMERRYGEAGVGMGRRMIELEDLAAVDASAVKVEGDIATIRMDGASRPLELRWSAGGWRLVVIGPEGGRPPATVEQIALVRASAQALNEVAAEIRTGQHATPEAAAAAVGRKLHAVRIAAAQQKPATQPAGTRAGAAGGSADVSTSR